MIRKQLGDRKFLRGRQRENGILPEDAGAVLTIGGKHIFRKTKEAIYYAAHVSDMKVYLEKYEWGENIGLIDWKAHQKAWKSIPPGQRFSVSKRIFGWFNSN